MRPPPDTVLLAARRWLEILPDSGGVPRAQALLTTHPRYSDLTPTQYASALAWLQDLDMLASSGSQVPAPIRILAAIFEKAAPPWVRDADDLVRSPAELPSDIISTGEVLGLSPGAIYDQLESSWGKVDAAVRARVGAAGEAALADVLRDQTSGQVDHVSARSDGFGYDIVWQHGLHAAHLEVKSTTRNGRFVAYLSRHEFNVMLRDTYWALVAVRLSADLELEGVGTVPSEWIRASVPKDVAVHGSWASVKLEIPASTIVNGIPLLGDESACLPSWTALPRSSGVGVE